MKSFPRAPDPNEPFVTRGRVWNRLVEAVERLDKLEVNDPLQLSDTPGGKVLSSKGGGLSLPLLYVHTADDGSGKYVGSKVPKPEGELSHSTGLSSTSDFGTPDDETDVAVWALGELDEEDSHRITDEDDARKYHQAIGVWGSDDLGRTIYLIAGLRRLGQYQFMLDGMLTTNAGGYDFARAHGVLTEDV